MARDPYPLQWPDGRPRTLAHHRKDSKFGRHVPGAVHRKPGFTEARDGLLRELERFAASRIVITSDLPTRLDGLPIASARASDPGIAVWWIRNGNETVMACDRWLSHAENMHALELSIAAMRGLDRWGGSDVVDRAFSGFAALPPGTTVARPWRDVLGGFPADLDREDLLMLAKGRHRRLIAMHHPDKGGDPVMAAEVNAALDEATTELG